MALGNYCSVCISPCFSLSPNHPSRPKEWLIFFYLNRFFTSTDFVVERSRKLQILILVCVYKYSRLCLCATILRAGNTIKPPVPSSPIQHHQKKEGIFLFKESRLETSGSHRGKVWGSTLGLLFHKSHM